MIYTVKTLRFLREAVKPTRKPLFRGTMAWLIDSTNPRQWPLALLVIATGVLVTNIGLLLTVGFAFHAVVAALHALLQGAPLTTPLEKSGLTALNAGLIFSGLMRMLQSYTRLRVLTGPENGGDVYLWWQDLNNWTNPGLRSFYGLDSD